MAGLFAVTVWFQLLALIAASTKILTWEDQKLLQAGDAGHAKSNCPKNRVIRQNNTFCDAGSTLWTGTIEIGTEDRNMFFMYFESLNESETDPLIIWLNGGPGASSMAGAFYEIGPCLVNSEINTTSRNLLSWTAVANMIFVDQPIGVGFSRSDDPALWANNLAEAAIDFERFLSGLFDLFPHLDDGKREFHLAGESFAGHYIPHFISAMRWNLSSVILVDPYIDSAESALGMYKHCCVGKSPHPGLNETACHAISKELHACKMEGQKCRSTYDIGACEKAAETCFLTIMTWFDNGPEGHPTHNPFDDRLDCNNPAKLGMCGGLGLDEVTTFLNSTEVKCALGQPDINYSAINYEFNARWTRQPEINLPSTRELSHLLADKGIPILVINGNNDIIGNTEGMIKILDDLQWDGRNRYREQKLVPWWFEHVQGTRTRGGDFKQFDKLALVTVNEAGHMAVADQRKGTLEILKRWTSKSSLES